MAGPAPAPAPQKAPEAAPVPPPQPKTPEQQKAFNDSVEKAEADRAAAGGPANVTPGAPDIRPTEVPRTVQPGDTLTGLSKPAGVPPADTVAANKQLPDPNLIKPGQTVAVPTNDPKTVQTRTDVGAAEAATRKAAEISEAKKAAHTSEDRALVDKDLKAANADADAKWSAVQKSAEDEIKAKGATTTFPVDEKIKPTVDDIRSRVPESATFQQKVGDAEKAANAEWQKTRTTGAQMNQLTGDARKQDAAVADMQKRADDKTLSPEQRGDAAERVKDLKLASDEGWNKVQDAATRELAFAGKTPGGTDAAKSTLDAMKATAPNDAKLQGNLDKAYDKSGAQQATADQKIAEATKNVQASDENVKRIGDNLSKPGGPGSINEANLLKAYTAAQKKAGDDRAALQGEIANSLQDAGKRQAYPEEGAGKARLDEIKGKLPPGDARTAEIADAAMGDATKTWQAQGVTRDTLGKVVKSYDDSKAANGALDAARKSADPAERAKIPQLEADAAKKAGDARAEAQRQIQGAYDAAGDNAKDIAASTRAETINRLGPQDEAFQQNVDDGLNAVSVEPKVKAVADAYDQGGAEKAAAQLDAVTDPGKGVSNDLAKRVVDGSMPTIQKIGKDFGDRLPKTNLTTGRPPEPFNNILTGVARATDRASGALSGGGRDTVAAVANAFAEPLDSKGSLSDPLRSVVKTATDRSSSATLPLALARAMQDRGDKRGASTVLSGAKEGFEAVRDRATDALDKFREVSDPLVQSRKDLEGLTSTAEADAATQKYLDTHPDVVKSFNEAADALDAAGRDVQHAGLTLTDDALAGVADIGGAGELKESRNGIVNQPEVQAAIGASTLAKGDLLHHVVQAEAVRAGEAGKPVNPGSLANSTRGLSKELYQAGMMTALSNPDVAKSINVPSVAAMVDNLQGMADKLRPGAQVGVDPRRTAPLSGLLNAGGATAGGFALVQTLDQLNSGAGPVVNSFRAAYLSMGVAHQTAELSATLAAHGLAWGTGGAAPTGAFGKGVASYVATVLPRINPREIPVAGGGEGPKQLRTSIPGQLVDQPGWVRAATFIKAAGVAVDVASGINALGKKDFLGAGLYGLSAGGGVASILSGVGIGATALGPIGAGAMLAAGIGLTIKNEYEQRTKYQMPSKDFLVAAGVDPEKASILSDYSDSDGSPIGPRVVQAMADAGRDPRTFLKSVKDDPNFTADKLRKLWTAAMDIKPENPDAPAEEPRRYPEMLPKEEREKGRPYMGMGGPPGRPAPSVQDLTDLRRYAQYLFGAPVLGTA